MVLEEGRIINIPHHQAKLHTATPIVRDAIRIREAMLEVYGGLVDIIAKGKQEDAPDSFQFLLATRFVETGKLKLTDHGYPPASNIGPCSFLERVRQFSTVQVLIASSKIFGSSSSGGSTISFMASTDSKCQSQYILPRFHVMTS